MCCTSGPRFKRVPSKLCHAVIPQVLTGQSQQIKFPAPPPVIVLRLEPQSEQDEANVRLTPCTSNS
jgi:hypothetical protein